MAKLESALIDKLFEHVKDFNYRKNQWGVRIDDDALLKKFSKDFKFPRGARNKRLILNYGFIDEYRQTTSLLIGYDTGDSFSPDRFSEYVFTAEYSGSGVYATPEWTSNNTESIEILKNHFK
jgi:hypothetical protein